VLVAKGCVDERHSPLSIFKIALALMGFDVGLLQDKDSPKWIFKKIMKISLEAGTRLHLE
jgi:beta-lactamase class D